MPSGNMRSEAAVFAAFSCDTFVALPSVTRHNAVIFGKNSDRPQDEVQEVVHQPAADYTQGTTLQCTYVAIPQARHVHAVMLSKPAWIWGAEMGANEKGVCIGNEAVSTKLQDEREDAKEKLIGMDLVRLGLERGGSAQEAVDVITALLEEYGQGGPCQESPQCITYHNSFIVADPTEAWVLETAGTHWAARKQTEGVCNISNQLSIGTDITAMSQGLKDLCKEKGWWQPEDKFHFAKVMTSEMPPALFSKNEAPAKRYAAGKELLEKFAQSDDFSAESMMTVLRDTDSCICRVGTGARNIASTGSQVSILYPDKPCVHFFTATPNTACSSFKPFVFTPRIPDCALTTSMTHENDPARTVPRFGFKVDRSHPLHKAHAGIMPLPGESVDKGRLSAALQLESENLRVLEEMHDGKSVEEHGEWWERSIQAEYKLYSQIQG